MTWKLFCLTIVTPMSLKKKIELGYREHHRDGIGYRIPLMIYPSKQQNSREEKQ